MELEFFKLNWHLFAALAAILVLLALDPLRKRAGGGKSLSVMELTRLLGREQATIIDVSDKADYAKGHLPNAQHIPLKELPDQIKKLQKFKEKPVVVTCHAGNKSGRAAAILLKQEFKNVATLNGGFLAWQKENLPIEK